VYTHTPFLRVVYALSAGFLIAAASPTSRATVIWNQGTNGALSENPASPTPFTLAAGTNSIIATVGGGSGETGINQNWVNINIPTGLDLSQLVLASYTSTDAQGFIGVTSGTTFTGSVNTTSSYLGYAHYGTGATNPSTPTNLVGDDMLPLMGNNTTVSPGSAGFTPPLQAGSYTFLIQQLGATTNYQFDFDVSTVPEPTTGALLLGLASIFGFSRRRAQ
jgi:hypothetical protein